MRGSLRRGIVGLLCSDHAPPHEIPDSPVGRRGSCQTVGAPLALEERGDPPVPVGRPHVDQAADPAGQLDIAGVLLRAALLPFAMTAFDHVRARTASVAEMIFTGYLPWQRGR